MKLSTLKKVLRDPSQVELLRAELEHLMPEYKSLQDMRGSSIPIHVDGDAEIELTPKDVDTLCELFTSDQLGPSELAYVADAIELSSGVQYDGDSLGPFISEMTDPEINGDFTKQRAEEIRQEIDIQQPGA